MKSIHLILITMSITEIHAATCNVLSIEDAAKQGLIKLALKSKGGYTGDVIEMKIQNISNKKLDLKIEAGRKLDSKKNDEQDIIVTQSQEFFVNANQFKTINVFGMCCQAHNSAPKKNSVYSIGKLADSSLIKLASYIDKNEYYTNHSAQQAVWTISDNNSIGSIYGEEKELVSDLRQYVSKITGKIIPPYDITYEQQNSNDVLGRAKKIEGVFDYTPQLNGKVRVGIYDNQGHLVQLLFEDIAHETGDCKLFYTFRTKDLPTGTYYARMDMNGEVQKEMKIEF